MTNKNNTSAPGEADKPTIIPKLFRLGQGQPKDGTGTTTNTDHSVPPGITLRPSKFFASGPRTITSSSLWSLNASSEAASTGADAVKTGKAELWTKEGGAVKDAHKHSDSEPANLGLRPRKIIGEDALILEEEEQILWKKDFGKNK